MALWLENLGFGDLKTAFMTNSVDGAALAGLSAQKLADDFGLADEGDAKKILRAHMRKAVPH